MNIIEAVFLGIIQGLTEFLPISSTGHLTVTGKLLDIIANPERWTAFIAVIQLGTLIAVLFYFRIDLILIVKEFLRDNLSHRKKLSMQSINSKMGWYLIIATLPVIVIGLGFKDFIEGVLTKNLYLISASLIILAIILAIADKTGKFTRTIKDLKWSDALIVGIAQALALIPGSSRSGTTITVAIFLGCTRETAARFSFLMSIPAILASGLFQFYQALDYINLSGALNIVLSIIAAAIVGYLSIEFLLRYLRKRSMIVFVVYRIIVGAFILFLIVNSIIQP